MEDQENKDTPQGPPQDKSQVTEQAGRVNWDALEREPEKKKKKKKVFDNKEAVEAEKGNLSEEELSLPYPADFLADVNLLNKEIGNDWDRSRFKDRFPEGGADASSYLGDDEATDEEE